MERGYGQGRSVERILTRRKKRLFVNHLVVQNDELSPAKSSTTTSDTKPLESLSSLNCTLDGKVCPPSLASSSRHPKPRVHMYGNLVSAIVFLPTSWHPAALNRMGGGVKVGTHSRYAHQHAPKRPKSTTLSPSAERTFAKQTVFLIGALRTEMKKNVHPMTGVSFSGGAG